MDRYVEKTVQNTTMFHNKFTGAGQEESRQGEREREAQQEDKRRTGCPHDQGVHKENIARNVKSEAMNGVKLKAAQGHGRSIINGMRGLGNRDRDNFRRR